MGEAGEQLPELVQVNACHQQGAGMSPLISPEVKKRVDGVFHPDWHGQGCQATVEQQERQRIQGTLIAKTQPSSPPTPEEKTPTNSPMRWRWARLV